jgi:PAS domain S-box-containing protein
VTAAHGAQLAAQGARLAHSEERYRLLADSMEDFVSLNDRDGNRLYISPSFYRATGYTPAEIEHSDFRVRVHPDDLANIEQARADNLRGQRTRTEYRFRCRDGAYVWLEIQATPLRGHDGQVEKILCCSRNITDRKQAEEALRASEERFRTLSTTAPVGIFLSDGSGGCSYVNPRLAEICGLAPPECLGLGWLQSVHSEDRERLWTAIQFAVRAQQEFTLEFRLLRRDGQERWVHVHTARVLSPDRTLQMNVGIVQDTTERKHAEEILRKSEERYRLLAENATDVIVRVSLEGNILYISPACRVLTGFYPEEFVGRSMYEFFHDEDAEPMRGWHAHVLQETAALTFEYRARCKDGSYVWCEATARARRDAATGAALDVIRVVRNIAARKLAEEAARRHQEQMAHIARVNSLGEMVSGLAHELAQPLSAILYYARGARTQLLAGVWGVSQAADTLQKVAGQAERAGQFIRGLKAFVRKVPPNRVPTDLNAVVRDALGFVTPLARQQQVAIQLDLGENLPLVLVERIPLEQVVINLINNGIDALQSTPAAARHLWVRTYVRADGAVCVTVRDAGPGLLPEVAAHVFDPFFTTKQKGTGLGLSISRTIVEGTHAGKMWLEPNPGRGAVFGFALPVVECQSNGAAAPAQE